MSSITTFTGKHFDPMNPDINSIDIKDIAHALSLTCRGNGHVQSFFSVAQHCINCAEEAYKRRYSNKVILACLLHDASEAYMSDVPRPFKKVLKEYIKAEDYLLDLIYHKYLGGLTAEEKRLVKEIDDDMLYFDLKYLLNEIQDRKIPRIHIELNYEFVPFKNIERYYLEIFEHYSKQL